MNTANAPLYATGISFDIVSKKIFRNGRQQASVRITMDVIGKDGNKRSLTTKEKNSVRLFKYGTSSPIDATRTTALIPMSDDHLPSFEGWLTQREPMGFEPFPGATHAESSVTGSEVVTLFLTCEKTSFTGTMAFGFFVEIEDTWALRSDGYSFTLQADGSDRKSTFDGTFDTGAFNIVESIIPDIYSGRNYRMSPEEIPSSPQNDDITSSISIDAGRGGAALGIHSVTKLVMDGAFHYMTDFSNANNPCFLGITFPGESTIHYHQDIIKRLNERGIPHPPGHRPPESQRIGLMFCLRTGLLRGDYGDLPDGAITVKLVDMYGSDQDIQIRFVKGTRTRVDIL